MTNTEWIVSPKFNVNDTVYISQNNAVYKMRVSSIQPIIQEHPVGGVKLTIRYYIRGAGNVSEIAGKLVEESLLFSSPEGAFK
jgi:hypothetical protein